MKNKKDIEKELEELAKIYDTDSSIYQDMRKQRLIEKEKQKEK